jgi:hypothetical protein
MPHTKIAMNREERHTVVQLRSWIPEPLPDGWSSNQEEIQRVNDYKGAGTFARLVSNAVYRLYFEARTCGPYSASLSLHTGIPITDAQLEEVRQLFFDGREVTSSRLLPGLARFDLVK